MMTVGDVLAAIEYERRLTAVRHMTDQQIGEVFGEPRRGRTPSRKRWDSMQPDGVIVGTMYRPYDVRMIYWTPRSDHWNSCPRGKGMQQLLSGGMYFPNLADPLDCKSEPIIGKTRVEMDELVLEAMGGFSVEDGEIVYGKTLDYYFMGRPDSRQIIENARGGMYGDNPSGYQLESRNITHWVVAKKWLGGEPLPTRKYWDMDVLIEAERKKLEGD